MNRAVGVALTTALTLCAGQAIAQPSPDPGHIAAPDVAGARGTSPHTRNHKPRHQVGAPGKAASPSISADKGTSGAPSGSSPPASPPGAPAEAAAPSVAHGR
jgi:hypothetical protein